MSLSLEISLKPHDVLNKQTNLITEVSSLGGFEMS